MSDFISDLKPSFELKKEGKKEKIPDISSRKKVLKKKLKELSFNEGEKNVQLQQKGEEKISLWDKGVEAGARGIEGVDVKAELFKYLKGELEKLLPKDMEKRDEVAFHLTDTIINRIVEEEYPEFFDAIHNVKGNFANWLRKHLAFNLDIKPVESRERPPKRKTEEEIFRENLQAALLSARRTPGQIEADKKREEEERAKDDADFIIAYNKCLIAETLEGKKTAYEEYLKKHPKGIHATVARRNVEQFNEIINQKLLEKGILKKDIDLIFKPTFDWDKKFVEKVGVRGEISYETIDFRALLKGEAVLTAPFTSDASLEVKAHGELGFGSKKRGVDIITDASLYTESLYKSPTTSSEFAGKIVGKYDEFQADIYSKYRVDFYGRSETTHSAGIQWEKDKSKVRLFWERRPGGEDFFGLRVGFRF